MNGYERALRTFRFQDVDCVATWGGWIVSAGFFEYVTGKRFWDDPLSVAIETYRKLDVDILLQGIYLPATPDEWRTHTDEVLVGAEKFQSVADVIAYIESLPSPAELAKEFDFDGRLEAILRDYLRVQDRLGEDMFCLASCGSARFTWYSVFGYERYLTTMALYPDAVRKLFEWSAQGARLDNAVRAELVRQNKLPSVFFTGQDICGQRGPMVSPQTLRSLYYPSVRHALSPLTDIGADIIWHSDGYIIPLVDDLLWAQNSVGSARL